MQHYGAMLNMRMTLRHEASIVVDHNHISRPNSPPIWSMNSACAFRTGPHRNRLNFIGCFVTNWTAKIIL